MPALEHGGVTNCREPGLLTPTYAPVTSRWRRPGWAAWWGRPGAQSGGAHLRPAGRQSQPRPDPSASLTANPSAPLSLTPFCRAPCGLKPGHCYPVCGKD